MPDKLKKIYYRVQKSFSVYLNFMLCIFKKDFYLNVDSMQIINHVSAIKRNSSIRAPHAVIDDRQYCPDK